MLHPENIPNPYDLAATLQWVKDITASRKKLWMLWKPCATCWDCRQRELVSDWFIMRLTPSNFKRVYMGIPRCSKALHRIAASADEALKDQEEYEKLKDTEAQEGSPDPEEEG